MPAQMRLMDWVLLIVLSILWGGSFFFSEIALFELSPIVVVWGRVGVAALMLLLILKVRGIRLPTDIKIWVAFLVMGGLNNVIPFTLIVWGQVEITGALASVFNATTPMFTIVLAQFLTSDEKVNSQKIGGILLGFCGVIIMVGLEALEGLGVAVWAQLAILLAAVSYGCAAIWGRRFKDIDPMVSATGQVSMSTLMMTPLALFFGFPDGIKLPSVEVLGAVIGIAFFCTVLAYILYFKILQTSGATNLMLVTFLIPLSAIALGNLFLGERLESAQIIGMIFILAGLLVIDGRLFNLWRLRQKNHG